MTEPSSSPPDSAQPVPPTDADVPPTHPTGTVDEATVVPKAIDPAVSLQTAFGIPAASSSAITGLANRTLGQYELLELLGQGGMGAVYKARHINLDKLVALKLLRPDFMQSDQSVARFKREMKAVGKISHPHIVQAFDAGQINGTHYLTMELVVGTDLHHLVKQRGPLPVKDACKAIRQAALGLHAAHKEGLVHRDIKPSNLLLAKNGQIKILDLGLALIGDGTPHEAITSTGQVLGTPDYMAPEQWEDTHATDLRTDLYALGCTLFYLLTGRAPYATDEYKSVVKKMSGHVNAPIPDLKAARPDVPDGVCAIYQRLMSKRPEDRYASAAALAQALAPFSSSKTTEAPAVEPPSAPVAPPRSDATSDLPANTEATETIAPTVNHVVDSESPAVRKLRQKTLTGLAGLAVLVTLIGISVWFTQNRTPIGLREAPSRQSVPVAGKQTKTDVATIPATVPQGAGWHGWPADAPKPAIAPFDADQAKKHQEEWAAYLKVPVEYENSIGMKFRLIPPGEFMMGSTNEQIEQLLAKADPAEFDTIKSESPRHQVILTKPLYLGTCEVTQDAYATMTKFHPSEFSISGSGNAKVEGTDTSQFPVECVTWDDAADFCSKLNIREYGDIPSDGVNAATAIPQAAYRLPTEAEWEFACRAGTASEFWFGDQDNELASFAWMRKTSGGRTHSVGTLAANAFGLFDVAGNVCEWVQDRWSPTYYEQCSQNLCIDPINDDMNKTEQIFRGGTWSHNSYGGRSAFRQPQARHFRSDYIGFRVALSTDAVHRMRVNAEMATRADLNSPPRRDEINFADERKTATRFLRLGKGKATLGNKDRQPIGELRIPYPKEPFFLQTIDLAGADVSTDEFVVFTDASEIEHLNLASNPRITPSGLNALASLRKLQSLDVSHTAIDSESMSLLKNWPELRRLDLTATRIDDAGLDHLASCPRLEYLAVGKTKVTNEGLAKVLPHCPYLKELHLESQADDAGTRAVSALKGFKFLRSVRCSADQLTPEGIDALRALPQFEEIQLRSPTSNDAVALIPGLSVKLQRFECVTSADSDTGISAVGYQSLQRCRQLIHLQFGGKSGSPTDASLVELATLANLHSMDLAFPEPARQYTRTGVTKFRELRPDVEFTVDGKTYPALSDWPGKFEGSTSIEPWNLPPDAPAPAVMPFTADEAVRHQAAWAQFLKLPIEQTSQATGMKFRLIPPSEMEVKLSEGTHANVRVPNAFYIGQTEVTIGQYRKFVEATGYKTLAEKNEEGRLVYNSPTSPAITWRTPGQESDNELPVSVLSREDCQAFCEWLSNKDGATFRLPTDSEWEVAARAGGIGSSGFLTKREEAVQYGWIAGISEMRSHPVASKLANPFGIYDVIGNAHEYVLGTAIDSRTFVRGQNFNGSMWDELWYRWEAIHLGSDIGFRIVRQVTDEYESLPRFAEQPVLVERNSPLGPQVAVTRPTPIPGVRSWSVELSGDSGLVNSVAWSPKGDVIATGHQDTSVRLWDRDGNLKTILWGHFNPVTAITFSPDGARLATGDRRNTPIPPCSVRIWDVKTGACVANLPTHDPTVRLAWSPDGKHVVRGGELRIDLIAMTSGSVRTVWDKGGALSFAWSPDGRELCACYHDPYGNHWHDPLGPWLFDVESGKRLAELLVPEPKPEPQFRAVAWSHDGKWIAATRDKEVHIWDAQTRQHSRKIGVAVVGDVLAWLPNNELLAICGAVGEPNYAIVNTMSGGTVFEASIGSIAGISWSPNFTEFVVCNRGVVRFFDTQSGKMLRHGPELGQNYSNPEHDRFLAAQDGRRLQFKHSRLAERSEFDSETGQLLKRHKSPIGRVVAQAFDERWTAYQINDMEVRIEPKRFDQDPVTIQTPGLSYRWRAAPDGNRLAQAFEQEVKIWDPATGEFLGSLKHSASLSSFEWSPDGSQIATYSDDPAINIWDTGTREIIAQFKAFPDKLEGHGWMGASIMAWMLDRQNLWIPLAQNAGLLDVKTGRVMHSTNVSNGHLGYLTLAPNGDRLLTETYGLTFLNDRDSTRQVLGLFRSIFPLWNVDSRRFLSPTDFGDMRGFDVVTGRRLGTLWPRITGEHWLCVGPTGHYRGSKGAEEHIVYVAQLDDGSNITLSPAEFAQRFGWKNDPNKATLLKLDE